MNLVPNQLLVGKLYFFSSSDVPLNLFLVSQGELIWYTEWLPQANVAAFEPAIANFLTEYQH